MIERDASGKPKRLFLSAGTKRVPSKEAEALLEILESILNADYAERPEALAAIDAALDAEAEAAIKAIDEIDGIVMMAENARNGDQSPAAKMARRLSRSNLKYARDSIRARIAARQKGEKV